MKKIFHLLFIATMVMVFSGCEQEEEGKKYVNEPYDPIINPEGNIMKINDPAKANQKTSENPNKAEAPAPDKNMNQAMPGNANNSGNISPELVKKYDGAVLKTNLGDIEIKFYSEDAPNTVGNFLSLAAENFYDGTKFHRVIKGFMIQGGDPLSKDSDPTNDGTGGPGYTIPAEIGHKNTRGTIATARLGDKVNPKKDSSGSQFYINTVNNTSLDGEYTVFGEVVNGMDVVEKIENVKTGANDRPAEDVIIESIKLLEKKT